MCKKPNNNFEKPNKYVKNNKKNQHPMKMFAMIIFSALYKEGVFIAQFKLE